MARRNRRSGGGRGGTRLNWLVSGTGLDTAGVETALVSYSSVLTPIASGNTTSMQVVRIPTPAPFTGTSSVGVQRVRAISGSIFFMKPGASGEYYISVGVYKSQQVGFTTTWSIRNPESQTAGQRDDYLFLRSFACELPLVAALTAPWMIEVPINLAFDMELSGGEAINVTIGTDAASAGTINFVSYLRAAVSGIS